MDDKREKRNMEDSKKKLLRAGRKGKGIDNFGRGDCTTRGENIIEER